MINRKAGVLLVALGFSLWPAVASAQRGGCKDDAPEGSNLSIAGATEPGDRLVVSGRVVMADGQTGVAGVRVRVFHTDDEGYYSVGGMDESEARLCGVLETDAEGRYRIETIKPASYATGRIAAHIHYEVSLPEGGAQMFTLNFEGDPLLHRDASEESWGRIQPLERDADGTLHVSRDLRLR